MRVDESRAALQRNWSNFGKTLCRPNTHDRKRRCQAFHQRRCSHPPVSLIENTGL